MTLPVSDSAMALRVIRGTRGVMDTAMAVGSLDLGALSSLLPALGLAHLPCDYRALFDALRIPGGTSITSVALLPWPGPPRRAGGTLCVWGQSALVEASLRLAAGTALGCVGLRVPLEIPPAVGAGALEPLLARMGTTSTPLTLVVGNPRLTLDLVSPAPRDLQPVLEVVAERARAPRPAPSSDVAYELMPVLESADAAIRDERALNDVAAGIHRVPGAVAMALPAVDGDAADERVASALKAGEGVLVCIEPDMLRPLLPLVASRLRAVLVLGDAQLADGVQVELPERLIDAAHGHIAAGLLTNAAFQARDVEVDAEITTGETAVSAPCLMLAGVARRACSLGKAAVVDAVTADAVFALDGARQDGLLGGRCRVSVALCATHAPGVGRAVVSAFLQQNLKEGRAAGRSQKVRIKG